MHIRKMWLVASHGYDRTTPIRRLSICRTAHACGHVIHAHIHTQIKVKVDKNGDDDAATLEKDVEVLCHDKHACAHVLLLLCLRTRYCNQVVSAVKNNIDIFRLQAYCGCRGVETCRMRACDTSDKTLQCAHLPSSCVCGCGGMWSDAGLRSRACCLSPLAITLRKLCLFLCMHVCLSTHTNAHVYEAHMFITHFYSKHATCDACKSCA